MEIVYDGKSAYTVSASFAIFSKIAEIFGIDEEASSSLVQLFIVETMTAKGDYGGGIWEDNKFIYGEVAQRQSRRRFFRSKKSND